MVSNTAPQSDDPCNLIVNYLPQTLTDDEFEAMFKSIGPLKTSKVIRDKTTGYSYGYGFVEYTEAEHAQQAIKLLDGLQLQNKRLKVSRSRTGTDVRAANLYVSNLPQSITEDELTECFVAYGSIIQTRILIDPTTKLSRCVGFIRFSTREEAQHAIDGLNGKKLNGSAKPIGVKFAEDNHDKAKKTKEVILGMMNTGPMMGGGLGGAPNMMGMGNQMGGMQTPFGLGNNAAAVGMGGMGMGSMNMGAMGMGQGMMGPGLMGPGPMNMGQLSGMVGGVNSQFGPASNQFGMGYQGNMGGGPMRGGNQMRQRMDPMSVGNTMTAMKGMNGTGAGHILFVYNIGPDTDERALWQMFNPFGALQKVNVIRDTEKKQGKGYGFVTMVNLSDAYTAIQNLNGFPFKGKQLQVSLKQPKSAQPAVPIVPAPPAHVPSETGPNEPVDSNDGNGYTLFVYNIGMDANERALWSLFNPFGGVQRVNIIRSSETNLCKGFGFVTMVEKQAALNAIQSLNGFFYNGKQLQVSFKQDGGKKENDSDTNTSNNILDVGAKFTSFF